MKKHQTLLALLLLLLLTPKAYANMAAPANPDIGTTITFEKNEELSVRSEVLDIKVEGTKAQIQATYTMENTADQTVTTPSMFLSPNLEEGGTSVTVDGQELPIAVQSYAFTDTTQVETRDWQYVVLSEEADTTVGGERVDAILFNLEFAPGQQSEVTVAYTSRLGGYPDADDNTKRGTLEYYLRPAALWNGFSNLTINLYLDEDMPVLQGSSLDFEQVAPRTYRYTSDTLPQENLSLFIDQSWWQTLWSTFRNPYLQRYLVFLAPVIVVVLAGVGVAVWKGRRAARRRRGRKQ